MPDAPREGINFTPDGRFADQGVLKAAGVMVRDAAGNSDFDDGAPGRGTYRIANYTLEVKYSNGRVKQHQLPSRSRDAEKGCNRVFSQHLEVPARPKKLAENAKLLWMRASSGGSH